jgi:hypothetical protein
MNVRGRFGNFVRSEYGNIVSWKITRDAVKRAIEAVTESIMEQVSSVDFDAGGIVQTKGINKFATSAEGWREEGHQCVESQSVREDRFIAAIEVAAWNSRSIEREAHVREARANKLSVDR